MQRKGFSSMELRRHYFVLPSQKVNILKSQLFLDLQNGGGHRQTTVLKTGEADRQAQGVMAYQNRYSGNHLRNQCWWKNHSCNWIPGGSVYATLKIKVSRGTQSYGNPHSILRLNPRSSPRFHSKYGRKVLFPSCF